MRRRKQPAITVEYVMGWYSPIAEIVAQKEELLEVGRRLQQQTETEIAEYRRRAQEAN